MTHSSGKISPVPVMVFSFFLHPEKTMNPFLTSAVSILRKVLPHARYGKSEWHINHTGYHLATAWQALRLCEHPDNV